MHEQGIYHLDLKPGNILLKKGKKLKIIDFGASKIFSTEIKINNTTGITYSLHYVAPEILSITHEDEIRRAEILMSRTVDFYKKIDHFSLGIVLFRLLSMKNY